jgi:P-type Cu+ transporter
MQKTFNIEGMHCAGCVASVEKSLKSIAGIDNAIVNLALKNVTVSMQDEVSISKLKSVLDKTSYSLVEDSTEDLSLRQNRETLEWKSRFIQTSVLGIPLLIYSMIEMFFIPGNPHLISILFQFLLVTPIMLISRLYYIHGVKALIYKSPNMYSLVAIGTGAAYIYSIITAVNLIFELNIAGFEKLYFESAGVILLFITMGRWMEAKAKGKTTEALASLLEGAPKSGLVKRDGRWQIINVDEIIVGDQIKIKPGSQIPIDGIVIEGESHIDESAITGESSPVRKEINDPVTAATINTSGALVIKAQKVGAETMYSRIIEMVKEAQGTRAPIQAQADKIASIFVPLVMLLAVLGFISWLAVGQSLVFAMNILISVLIIACPCALGLATPTAMVVGTGIGARLGIHFKSAETLERMSRISTIVFDKTGTLTTGKSTVTNIDPGHDKSFFLSILYSLESQSEHHIAQTIISYLSSQNVKTLQVDAFEAVSGFGIHGIIEGKLTQTGSLKYLEKEGIEIPEKAMKCDEKYKMQGNTVVHTAYDSQWLGLITVSDKIRVETEQVIYDLQKRNIETWMITGDHAKTAEIVGSTIGIKNIMSEILPEDKSKKVNELRNKGKIVAMVGDGINDAPALAIADVGISISTGTDVAIETADLILMRPDLTGVKKSLVLSKAVVGKIQQNLFWAFFYNIVGIPIALGLLYPFTGYLLNPIIAGGAMAFSSVSVVSNTLMLKRKRF